MPWARQACRWLFGRQPVLSLVVVAAGVASAAMQSADVEQWWILPLAVALALGLGRWWGRPRG